MKVIEVNNLIKNYGKIKAVDGVSFDVNEGEIFGMVGPNGAGKTTTIECIEGLRKPDEGIINVLNLNPSTDREKFYEKVGVQLQETNYQDKIKVYEICELFASLYKKPLNYTDLLKRFGLYDFKNGFVMKLSGGQKQKLSIILALISNPEIIFLDEITTGLDPKARRDMWKIVKELKDEGKTIFLTTHYMEEAEFLCDRVAIIDKGKIVELDTPEKLIEKSGIEDMISFETKDINIEELKKVKGVNEVSFKNGEVTIYGRGEDLLKEVVDYLYLNRIYFKNLKTKKPNLEDTFLKFTGREYVEVKDENLN
ncbi:MAG TPA: ABC transporter ATP-binding protein [Caldisericia bacterium]|jgi:ABC-2 type transport system ATP-binding protein|nr:ABC transporter ATP-binding protein [Caldisericia bacterium]HOC52243.1 ABC transporter ATP-binding protein [Caldisericia bacterium]HPB34328.1 ABC transporter ATP-binding protein [Caldisericia bacterium]HQL66378.1 ABC transporter ATP-binding protein [Caldisericia bacterium]HQN47849.1 ABC transporter ATP-binding protein [Caldisericia bacterium]